jgi:hypothetical protein
MKAKSLIELEHERSRAGLEHARRYRPHLFGLRLGVLVQTARLCGQENLNGYTRVRFEHTGTHGDDPCPSRAAVELAPSFETMTAGFRCAASPGPSKDHRPVGFGPMTDEPAIRAAVVSGITSNVD